MANQSFNNTTTQTLSHTEHMKGSLFFEKFFKRMMTVCVAMVFVLLVGMVVFLAMASGESISKIGIEFFFTTEWAPNLSRFGALPFIIGTLTTSFVALVISIPFSFAVAILLGEYFTTGVTATFLNSAMELLAGIPSIIYGLVGFLLLVSTMGSSVLTSSIVLAIMIIPYSASIAREVIQLVPNELKEAAYSLGATRFEVLKKVVIPYSASGIVAGILLSFGRALGETMAVTMVIGNNLNMPDSPLGILFSPGQTIASLIANQFTESSGLHQSALIELGLVLFIITVLFGFLGRMIIAKTSVKD